MKNLLTQKYIDTQSKINQPLAERHSALADITNRINNTTSPDMQAMVPTGTPVNWFYRKPYAHSWSEFDFEAMIKVAYEPEKL